MKSVAIGQKASTIAKLVNTLKTAGAARVYKISRDDRGERLTHIKVTGGSLKAKQLINGEKINQIRIYSGEKYTSVNEAVCGSICAITGLEGTYAGQALGRENNDNAPVLSPVLNYKINLPAGTDPLMMLPKLKMIEEEEPQLHRIIMYYSSRNAGKAFRDFLRADNDCH